MESIMLRGCALVSPLVGLKSRSHCALDVARWRSTPLPRITAHNEGKGIASWSVVPMRSGLTPRNGLHPRRLHRRPRAKDDDFEIEDDPEFEMERAETEDDEEEDFRDYETEYESPVGYNSMQRETDSFTGTEGEEEESEVSWKINEEEFHKFKLLTCDFFIRKVPDPDDDVYDFREMYVTPTDTDIYSIPLVLAKLPKKPVRCSASFYEVIYSYEPPVDEPRAPLCKTEFEVMKVYYGGRVWMAVCACDSAIQVFLMKHLKDRRAGHANFMLDFEEIYVIDCKTKSFSRAEVQIEVPGGKNRDRTKETLIVRDSGTTFRIILEKDALTPDQIVQGLLWDRTRENMENYLKGFRDYEVSNWF